MTRPAEPHSDPRWLDALADIGYLDRIDTAAARRLAFPESGEPDDGDHGPAMPDDLLALWLELDAEYPTLGEVAASIQADAFLALGGPLTAGAIISRSAWGARAPRSVQAVGARNLACHYGGGALGWPWDHARCYSIVRGWQSFHLDGRGWSDIAYSGCPCPHGFVFEGRGPGVRTAANGTTPGNSSHLALSAVLGDGDAVTDDLLRAFWAGAEWLGVAGGRWDPHSYFVSTSCPGPVRPWVLSGHPRPGGGPKPKPVDSDPKQRRGGPHVLLVGE